MISEIINALFLTYLATEYLLASTSNIHNSREQSIDWQKKSLLRNLSVAAVVGLLNVFDRVSGAARFLNNLLKGFLHLPKGVFVAFSYVLALYSKSSLQTDSLCTRHT